ncbi:hypothetical protein SARC_04759 [Sphaeroforma arctica JP610]|uniref:Dol-P-Glc:Glc(2)Man(9)GlcNAc(2)-PP-Dol alpha-1,2-glucosyltransferase n=1 Tax=Sphaeroforma arctica JP610 TaxID=667725 RepID=A0A0L0G2B1_9EUKA|nr:hypothetical protein SARC_04759 [Sphaeroforma arctica JP610]KNC82966.1 hypothetical protein SARC_04759 [Sphaeroforma arctica JP610]|eukprot:XP_014156868.1 hypothetical protein SARC_04759 [Sphaeroforma arctica JP610]
MRFNAVTVALLCVAIITFCSVAFVNSVVTVPYMDEIFHIPQAQRYCQLDFTWDDKITTLPGLYLVTLATLEPLSYFLDMKGVCTTASLRYVNCVFALGTAVCAQSILRLVNRREGAFVAFTMLAVVLFPLNYFSGLLYYTDAGSTCFVLLCYLLSLRRQHIASAAAGVIAILFRQSNVLWVAFTAANCVNAYLSTRVKLDIARRYPLTRRTRSGASSAVNGTHPATMAKHSTVQLTSFVRVLLRHPVEIIRVFYMYVAVGVGFLAFVVGNGGIVVGDKSNHAASLHVSQLLYYVLFTGALCAPTLLQAVVNHAMAEKAPLLTVRNLLVFGALTMGCAAVLYHFNVEHEFLLADNRHFTFYIWKRIIGHETWRYVLTPVYALGILSVWITLRPQGAVFRTVFLAVVAAVVIPQRLLEFRYFIVPYIMFRLHLQPGPADMRVTDPFRLVAPILLELAICSAINVLSLYAFLFLPFSWGGSDDVQRFMW